MNNVTPRIAVLGGTFDPVHYGHLAAAEAVVCRYAPDRVLFIPSARPPHKNAGAVTDESHRYQMTLLATADHPDFEVSAMELDRPGPSYTADTVRNLNAMYPEGTEILFIIGADAIEEILTWKDAAALLTLCRFVAVTRPGFTLDETYLSKLRGKYGARIDVLNIPGVAVSGTELREKAARGDSLRFLVPPDVENYIRKNGLYGPVFAFDFNEAARLLKKRLSEERFAHVLGVVWEAERLARAHGADIEQVRTAALLHDCAKEFSPDKKRAMCEIFHLALDEVMDKHIELTHGILGAETAAREYGVKDGAVYSAIRYHSTGHKDMNVLDKIIYLADLTEPGRVYPEADELRALAVTDLDAAVKTAIKRVIQINKKRDRLVHPDSFAALKSLHSKKKKH